VNGTLAVVTGAGSGIGAAISGELASRGFTVIPTDIDESAAARTAEACGARPRIALTSPTPETSQVCGAHRRAPWNTSCLGLERRRVEDEALPRDHARGSRLSLGVNLRGLFLTSQSAARAMVEARTGGNIVNIASMAGKQGRVPFLADYVASKFGVVGLTQAMAFELAEHRIRVNSICPGYVATPDAGP